MDASTQLLQALGARLSAALPAPRISVAYSGGADSSVLLHGLARLRRSMVLPALRALHVNHGLVDEAERWQRACAERARALGVDFEACRVAAGARRGESPEAAARGARYGALAARLRPGELLCTAHHQDDQAETLLLQLLRGSGPHGLAAMAPQRTLGRGRLLRPLLDQPRALLGACAAAWGIPWIEDASNASPRYPRNRLRHEVVPVLADLQPGLLETLTRAARLQAEAARAVDALARADARACAGSAPPRLSRARLGVLDSARRRAALRIWLLDGGFPVPNEARLQELERQLARAGRDRQVRLVWPGAEVRVHGDDVCALRPPAPMPAQGAWAWTGEGGLELPWGRLTAEPVLGGGLRAGGPLEVRVRAGGERCRPGDRRHSQTLKRLLQERRVPPWERARLPLLYRDGELAAVAHLWVCAGHEAGEGEFGWRIGWQPY